MKVQNVVIVGGGSAGWMTCAALLKLCPWLNVVLIESDKPTVGVGESTLGHINKYMKALGLEDKDWMPACNATYKNSIQFTNFREKGTVFQYPFGKYDYNDTIEGMKDWFDLAREKPLEYPPETFAEFFNKENSSLVKHNKQWDNRDERWRNFNWRTDVAYHMDATLFGEYLRDEICYKYEGRFTHIIGEVRGSVKDVDRGGSPAASNREIKQLAVRLIEDKRTIGVIGDLFIDCSGFSSVLLEQYLGTRFVKFDDLANDKAFFARIPYLTQEQREQDMHNVTDCEAAENGWMWSIPLWNRIGVGYCWSSRFAMESETLPEFENWIEQKYGVSPDEYEVGKIDIKHGYHEKAWNLNVVAIGLSYGFVEPLESTGLLTTHENILRLVDVLQRRDGYVTNMEREWFNYSAQREVIGFSKFVAMHYALSMRTDNPYWRWCTQRNDYMKEQSDMHVRVVDNYERMGSSLDLDQTMDVNMAGLNYIVAGMGIKLGRDWVNDRDSDELVFVDTKHKEYWEEVESFVSSDECPSHYEYLKEYIYGGDEIRAELI
tara:strand:- start:3940 stop:5580 length:1641 start_codon:yes stop_codon:yes gene_type:complete